MPGHNHHCVPYTVLRPQNRLDLTRFNPVAPQFDRKLPPSDALLNISGVVQLWGMSDTRHHDKTLPASLAESVAG
ncbi:hypothetical protein ACLEIY_19340, partial [Acetobacter tropicalis]|uniref:hypothetical protein n=1 Tax=Acetobacter tropicalis TaxID=104102 RepID=UPI003975D23F